MFRHLTWASATHRHHHLHRASSTMGVFAGSFVAAIRPLVLALVSSPSVVGKSDIGEYHESESVSIGRSICSLGLENVSRDSGHLPAINLICRPLGLDEWLNAVHLSVVSDISHFLRHRFDYSWIRPRPKPCVRSQGNRSDELNICDHLCYSVIRPNQSTALLIPVISLICAKIELGLRPFLLCIEVFVGFFRKRAKRFVSHLRLFAVLTACRHDNHE
jgi:hypothetical protein